MNRNGSIARAHEARNSQDNPEALLGWALLVRSGLFSAHKVGQLWTRGGGPTDHCWSRATSEEGSASEVLFLRAALDTWNRRGGFDLGRALAVLDEERLGLIAELLADVAAGRSASFVDKACCDATTAAPVGP